MQTLGTTCTIPDDDDDHESDYSIAIPVEKKHPERNTYFSVARSKGYSICGSKSGHVPGGDYFSVIGGHFT